MLLWKHFCSVPQWANWCVRCWWFSSVNFSSWFYLFFTISFSLFTFLLCYFIEDKSFALCTCQEQGNRALLLQCAFTRETTQTHKTLRVNEHSEATDWRGRTYHMGTWKSAQLKPILTRVGEVGNCIHFENVS